MKAFLRITALILTVVLLAAALPSCGKKATAKITNVFREEAIKLPEKYSDNENFYVNDTHMVGDVLYARCNTWENTANGGSSRTFLLPINSDGTVGEEIDLNAGDRGNGGTNIQSMCYGEDGSIWMVADTYSYDDDGNYSRTSELRCLKDGKTTTVSLDALSDKETGEEFYVNNMEAGKDGTLVLCSWNGIKLIDTEGNIKDLDLGFDPMNGNTSINGIVNIKGKVYASIYSYSDNKSESKYCEVDVASGKFGDEITLSANSMYGMIFGPGYDYYFNDGTSVYGCTMGKDEKVEVLNFINSDINSNNINQVVPMSTDRFFVSGYDNETYMPTFSMLTRIPDDQIVEKEVITMSVPYFYYDLRNAVIKFNKANEKYRITVVDYSQYNTDSENEAGITKLNNELVSGKVPDILVLTQNMPYDSYISKGLFTDLYALMDADESFNRADYLENIFKAYETNGKLYSIIPRFNLTTFAGKTSLLGDMEHWTVSEFMDFVKSHPDLQIFDYEFNRSNFIQMFLMFARDSFIDKATGKCSFNSNEFRELLEFAKGLQTDDFWSSIDYGEAGQEFWQEYDSRFVDDRVLLTQFHLYDIKDSYKSLVNYTLKGDPTFIGFPSESGNGAAITSTLEFSISERSKIKDGAWEFIKTFIDEDAQMPVKNKWGSWSYGNGLPILRKAIDKMCEIAMTPPENNNYDDVIIAPRNVTIVEDTAAAVIDTDIAAAAGDTIVDTATDSISTDPIDVNGDGVIDASDTTDTTEVAETDDTESKVSNSIAIGEPIGGLTDPYSQPMTQAQVDIMLNLITGTTQIMRNDDKLLAIINEEAEAYFSGQKTIEQTIEIIQNRAEIYVNESR